MMALDNLRVLDFAHLGPGQFCSMMLADMGAEVIRVEQPMAVRNRHAEFGDNTATWRKNVDDAYRCFNRNKRSITLNLQMAEGREIVYRMADSTDVVVVGFRPAVPERLGIDYETLRRVNPGIVYCAMTGYGQSGPYRDLPGHDLNFVALGGALRLFGDPPQPIPNLIADYAGGALHAVIGILLGVLAREKSGRGQLVDIAYTDAVVALVGRFASAYLNDDKDVVQDPLGRLLSNPGYGVYQTKDQKHISLAALEPWFWTRLCRVLGKEDLCSRYGETDSDGQIRRSLARTFSTRTSTEWFELLAKSGIPVAEVHDLPEVIADPQVLSRNMVVKTDDSIKGKERHLGIAIKLSDTPGKIRSGAPVPGQQTRAILMELDFSDKDIDSLRERGVIELPLDSESSTYFPKSA